MPLELTCRQCGETLRVADEHAGRQAKCPACQALTTVPFETLPAADSAIPPTPNSIAAPPTPAGGSRWQAPNAGPAPPLKVQAIAIMMLVGGVVAATWALGWASFAFWMGLATCGLGCFLFLPATFSGLVAVYAIVNGIRLLGANSAREQPPRGTAYLQIACICCLDLVNFVLGIINLILLNDPEVQAHFHSR